MNTDWILFWHRHYQKPTLSTREMLLLCSRAHGDEVTLAGTFRRRLRRKQ